MIHRLPQIPDIENIGLFFIFVILHICVPCAGTDRLTPVPFTAWATLIHSKWSQWRTRSRHVSDLNVPNTQLIVGTSGKWSHTVTFPNLSRDWHIGLRKWHWNNTTYTICVALCVQCECVVVCLCSGFKGFHYPRGELTWADMLLSGDRRWSCAFLH